MLNAISAEIKLNGDLIRSQPTPQHWGLLRGTSGRAVGEHFFFFFLRIFLVEIARMAGRDEVVVVQPGLTPYGAHAHGRY